MTTELYWLTLTALMTALFWVPYILDRIVVRGLVPAISDREVETGEPHSGWAKRMMAAHRNAVENLAIFAVLVLTAHALGISTETTATAAAVYFFARLAHFVIYTAGLPVARTLAFFVGWLAQMAFAAAILSANAGGV